MISSKYMLEFMSFLTKSYPHFHETASNSSINSILEEFDSIFNEENRIKVLNKKQNLLDRNYVEIFYSIKDNVDFVDKFYSNSDYIKTYYLDIQINHIDKNFIIYQQNKK